MYEAIGVRDIDSILVSQDVDKPKDPASENSQALDGTQLKAFAGQQHDAHIMSHLMFGLSPIVGSMPNVAISMQKHIFEHIKFKAEEFVEAELFKLYGTDPDRLVSALQREAMVALKVAEFFQQVKQQQEQLSGAGQQQPDPLIELKKQEIANTAQRDQANAQINQQKLMLDQQKEQNDMAVDQARLAQAEQLAMEKNALTMYKQQNSGQGGR
jgi:hypothetical protein